MDRWSSTTDRTSTSSPCPLSTPHSLTWRAAASTLSRTCRHHLTPHPLPLTPHTSHLTPHTSHLTPHTLPLTSYLLPLADVVEVHGLQAAQHTGHHYTPYQVAAAYPAVRRRRHHRVGVHGPRYHRVPAGALRYRQAGGRRGGSARDRQTGRQRNAQPKPRFGASRWLGDLEAYPSYYPLESSEFIRAAYYPLGRTSSTPTADHEAYREAYP